MSHTVRTSLPSDFHTLIPVFRFWAVGMMILGGPQIDRHSRNPAPELWGNGRANDDELPHPKDMQGTEESI